MAKTWTKGGITFKRDKSGKVTRVLPKKKDVEQKKKSRARAEEMADLDLSRYGVDPGTSVQYDKSTGIATYRKDGQVVAQQQAKGLRVGRGSAVPTGRDVIVPTKSGGTTVIREGDVPVERPQMVSTTETISQVAIPRGTRRTVVPTAKELAMQDVKPTPSQPQLIDKEIQPAESMKPTYQDFPQVASEKLTKEISKVESREQAFDVQKKKDPSVLISEFGSREAAGLERVSLFAQKVGLKAARSATDLFSTVWNIKQTDIAVKGAVAKPFQTGYAFGETVLQVTPSDVLAEGLFDVGTGFVLSKASKLKYLDDLPVSTRRMTLDVDKDLFKARVKSGEFTLKGDVPFETTSTQLPIIEEATGQVKGFQTQLIGKEVTPELDLTKLDVPGLKPLDTTKQTTLSDVRITYDQPQVTRFETGSQTEFVGDMFLGRTTPKGEKVITELPISDRPIGRTFLETKTRFTPEEKLKLLESQKKVRYDDTWDVKQLGHEGAIHTFPGTDITPFIEIDKSLKGTRKEFVIAHELTHLEQSPLFHKISKKIPYSVRPTEIHANIVGGVRAKIGYPGKKTVQVVEYLDEVGLSTPSKRGKLFGGSKRGAIGGGRGVTSYVPESPTISKIDDLWGTGTSKLEGFNVRQAKEAIVRPAFKSVPTAPLKITVLPPISLLKPKERLAVTDLTKTRSKAKAAVSVIQQPRIMVDTLPAVKVRPKQAQKPTQVQTPDVFQTTSYGYRQAPPVDTTFKIEEVVKRDPPTSGPTPRILPSVDLKKKPKKKKGLFDVFVRRKGVFKKIGETYGAQQAIALGKQRVGQTLAASFKVIEKGTGKAVSPVDIGRSFRTSKREAGVIVQRRGARLSAGRERSEIKQAKKSKRMRF